MESNEANGPFIYLYRAFVPDSGGPGRARGGAGTSLAIAPYDTEGLQAMLLGHGVEVPNAIGQFGGLPGSCGLNFIRRDAGDSATIATLAANLDEMVAVGVEELGPKPGHIPLSARDVLGYSFQGGGGYGDPIKREPEAVLADIANRHVTEKAASTYYGVVVKNAAVDAEATARRREEIRAVRLDGNKPRKVTGAGDMRTSGGRFTCCCGCDLGPSSGNWKTSAGTKVVPALAYGPHIRTHADLELREHICNDCGSLLEAEVVRKGEEFLVTIALDA